jgi:large subunit ribosomal protein L2
MALKTYNPTTPSQRQLVNIDRSSLYKGAPVKALTEGQHSSGGRNNNGRITSRFRGGGHKQAYRKIDFRRTKSSGSNTIPTAPASSRSSSTRTASRPTFWRRSALPPATR